MAFKYRDPDESDVKSAANRAGGAFDSFTKAEIPKFKVKNGDNNIRLLPATWKDTEKWGNTWGLGVFVHYGIGPDNSTYLCPAKMGEGECPICDARADAPPLAEGEDDELKPGRRILCYLIDRDDEKAGPLMWAMPWTVERDILNLQMDKKLGLLKIDHPDEGYDLSFSRDGKGRNVKYVGMRIDRDTSPISSKPSRQEAWLDFIDENPIDKILIFHDAEYIDKVYRGKSRRKENDGEETTTKKPAAKKGREEKEEPKKRPAKGVAASDVDDMDEDDLLKVIETYDLDVDPEDFPKLSKLRAEVLSKLKAGKHLSGAEAEEEEPEERGKYAVKEEKSPKENLISEDDLDDMDETALTKLIKKHDLDVDPDDYPRESKLREAIAEALSEAGLMGKAAKQSATEKAKADIGKMKKGRDAKEEDEEADRDPPRGSKAGAKAGGAKSRPAAAPDDEDEEDEPKASTRPSRRGRD